MGDLPGGIEVKNMSSSESIHKTVYRLYDLIDAHGKVLDDMLQCLRDIEIELGKEKV